MFLKLYKRSRLIFHWLPAGGPGVHLSVAKLLPLVAKRLSGGGPVEKLHLVHRLDKETTGVFLIARWIVTQEYSHTT